MVEFLRDETLLGWQKHMCLSRQGEQLPETAVAAPAGALGGAGEKGVEALLRCRQNEYPVMGRERLEPEAVCGRRCRLQGFQPGAGLRAGNGGDTLPGRVIEGHFRKGGVFFQLQARGFQQSGRQEQADAISVTCGNETGLGAALGRAVAAQSQATLFHVCHVAGHLPLQKRKSIDSFHVQTVYVIGNGDQHRGIVTQGGGCSGHQ